MTAEGAHGAVCPKCGSDDVEAVSFAAERFTRRASCAGCLIVGPLGLVMGLMGSTPNYLKLVCKSCNNTFPMPGLRARQIVRTILLAIALALLVLVATTVRSCVARMMKGEGGAPAELGPVTPPSSVEVQRGPEGEPMAIPIGPPPERQQGTVAPSGQAPVGTPVGPPPGVVGGQLRGPGYEREPAGVTPAPQPPPGTPTGPPPGVVGGQLRGPGPEREPAGVTPGPQPPAGTPTGPPPGVVGGQTRPSGAERAPAEPGQAGAETPAARGGVPESVQLPPEAQGVPRQD